MPCTTNSAHAQHTFLRGCCESSCPCPGIASYQAIRYCECTDTDGQNQVLKFRNELCRVLGTLEGSYATPGNGLVTAIGATGLFSSVRCGTFTVTVFNSQAQSVVAGTVKNGVYTPFDNPALLVFLTTLGVYTLEVDGTACATITIIATA